MCLLAGSGFAQQAMPVQKLVEFIKSSVQQHMQDKEVASYLKTVRLTERLDPRVVEDLQGQGAGPKTVAELNRLSEASASLTAAFNTASVPQTSRGSTKVAPTASSRGTTPANGEVGTVRLASSVARAAPALPAMPLPTRPR